MNKIDYDEFNKVKSEYLGFFGFCANKLKSFKFEQGDNGNGNYFFTKISDENSQELFYTEVTFNELDYKIYLNSSNFVSGEIAISSIEELKEKIFAELTNFVDEVAKKKLA